LSIPQGENLNIILLESEETRGSFPRNHPVYRHVTKILKSQPGDTLEGGVINGALGTLKILEITREELTYQFTSSGEESPPPYPLELIIGTPRPPVAKRLIKDLTTWSINKAHFVNTQLGEKSYLESNLWQKEEYRMAQREGASQGRTTRILPVERHNHLASLLRNYDNSWTKILLHNGPDLPPLSRLTPEDSQFLLAIGPERGWTEEERLIFADAGFKAFQMGRAVLRTEVACHGAITAVLQQKNWFLPGSIL